MQVKALGLLEFKKLVPGFHTMKFHKPQQYALKNSKFDQSA